MDLAEIIEARRFLESPNARRRRRPRRRRIRKIAPAAADIVAITRQIRTLLDPLHRAVEEQIFPLLRRREEQFLLDSAARIEVRDDFEDELLAAIERIRQQNLELSAQQANIAAASLVGRANRRHRERFFAAIESAMGIDLAGIVAEGDLAGVLKLKTAENVNLIRTIPEQYFERIQTVVYEGVIQGRKTSKMMIEELRELGAQSNRRAKFIARDQTAKLTSALARERSQALGITEYIWRTSRDERVRESHAKRDGKRFRWDDPPAGGPAEGGHPGESINCRCTAEPVIVL